MLPLLLTLLLLLQLLPMLALGLPMLTLLPLSKCDIHRCQGRLEHGLADHGQGVGSPGQDRQLHPAIIRI